ncbi:hypothetical protein GCM10009037_11460 [Halarchaeum grantii]|uniref:STE24 endopeptidase n=1 Tax=Halarchaeum grantii TaxID=1193105 RepID=A0A830F168_9EURY|nr:hypothetical protein [Halarchaeum grantii]GGL29489.1 hypothetical protein GCM10009037_11460 [Halarchaeum grantii]
MSLLASAAALLVVSLLGYALARLYGAAVHGTESALTRLRRALYAGFVVVTLVAFVATVGAGGFEAFGDGPLGDLLTLLAMAAALVVADLAYYLGLWPAIRATRDLDASTAWAAASVGRWLAALFGAFALALYALGHVPTGSAWGVLGLGAGIVLLVYVGSGTLVRVSQSTRALTDAERERVRVACERVGLDPRSVHAIESETVRWAGVLVRGPPRFRTLLVGSHLLVAYDADALVAQVARAAGRARRGYVEAKFGAAAGFVVAVAGLVVPVGDAVAGALVAGGALTAASLLWHGRRVVYAADRDAAEATDPGTVIETYRAVAEDAGRSLDGGGGRIRRALRMRPSLRSRIARLEERAD